MSSITPWEQRHTQLKKLLSSTRVKHARQEALSAAAIITQTDDNAASAVASHHISAQMVEEGCEEEELGEQLDAALAVLWSSPAHEKDTNEHRILAHSSLKSMLTIGLSESSRDLTSITCLESNREGTVELVRCRMDRRIYVLKSTTKGSAKRGYKSNAPVTERRLLALSKRACLDQGKTAFTPACFAAFQSPASLHILMEYCPAGDLYHFLESAGQAPISNEARNKSGGLLSERYVKRYAIDMVAAISWIHEQGYMHRDIKPGNWLFDRSGHLLLCDLASAAPFANFKDIPANGNLPGKDGLQLGKRAQRRVLYRHCCLIGTADYIAPEIFWSADFMSRRKERMFERGESQSQTGMDSEQDTEAEEEEDDEEPPPDGPGLYGPECDWWSLGVVIFEMVYKRMPFFADKIADTMEMIKHHEDYFRLDSWVQCSPSLKDLLQKLITHSEQRIGFASSSEVKNHALFKGVDWSRPWKGEPVPFVPNLEPHSQYDHFESPGGLSVLQEEPSILHSPQVKQLIRDESTHLSQMWSGDPNDFPAFPNSVEMSRAAAEELVGCEKSQETEGEQSSEGTITNSSPSTRKALEHCRNSAVMKAETLWAKYDPTWIGFSYVPDRESFRPEQSEIQISAQSDLPSPIASPEASKSSNYLFSPQGVEKSLPMVSTPWGSREASRADSPGRSPVQATPFHPSTAHNLRRRAMETASRARSESVDRDVGQSFATPVRKTSAPNLAALNDRQQMMSNLKTPANVRSSPRDAVPASPYPFPLAATVARPRKTPAPARVPSSGLRRVDLQRARSASVETGEGSDSRCSGGSNVKRDISEREAWKELKVAVMQSARKGKRDFLKELESKLEKAKKASEPTHRVVVQKRPALNHAATDSIVRRSAMANPPKEKDTGKTATGSGTVLHKKGSAFGLGALGGALKGKRPTMPRFLSHQNEAKGNGKPVPLKPVVSMTSPEKPASIISSSSASSSPQNGEGMAKTRLMIPGFWGRQSGGEASRLQKKKSARQLLLKAQDRETPTKVASRSDSPLLTSFQNLSMDSNLSSKRSSDVKRSAAKAMIANKENQSPTSRRNSSTARTQIGRTSTVRTKQMITLDSDDSTTVSHDRVDDIRSGEGSIEINGGGTRRSSPPPQPATITMLKREENGSQNRIRRRDSRETLSQYRQGINPDETMEEMESVLSSTSGQMGRPSSMAMRRGPKRIMSVQVLRPTSAASNRSASGTMTGDATSLSSPSLPSFPDAFSLDAISSKNNRLVSATLPSRTGLTKDARPAASLAIGGAPSLKTAKQTTTTTTTTITTSNRFHTLPNRRSMHTLRAGSRLTDLENKPIQGSDAKTSVGYTNRQSVLGKSSIGEMSVLGGLDWRYESMQVDLSQVEQRLARIKARLRED